MSSTTKTILFLGATGGCAFSALSRSLAAGHACIALCRTPAKLTDKLSVDLQRNLHVVQGNARETEDVARCLVHPSRPGHIVDMVISSIGARPNLAKLSMDDPTVCEAGMKALLSALAVVRKNGADGKPRIVALSTTGISDLGRDVPLLFVPLYHVVLKTPHKDKKIMEDALIHSGEEWTIVRPSLLTDGPEATETAIRAGVVDIVAHKVESKAVGYTISREDVGKWVFENLVQERDATWVGKAAAITY